MTEERVTSRPSWNDRVFDAIPLSPIGIAAGLALVLPATYLPAARRYETIGARRNLEALGSAIAWRPGQLESASAELEPIDPGGRRTAGLLALLLIPVTALLVDRDPFLYFQKHYWDMTHFWTYALAAALCWNGGILVHAISRHTRCFSGLARGIPQVDLLNLAIFKPFTRQAMLSALPGVVVLSFLALNVGDRGFLWAIGALGSIAVASTTASLLILMRGVRERIRDAKQLEVARVNAAIRGDPAALADSPIAARAEELGLGDALAWRSFVEALPEWPFDAPMRTRFLLYVALPLGSWLGGALVERLLDAALG